MVCVFGVVAGLIAFPIIVRLNLGKKRKIGLTVFVCAMGPYSELKTMCLHLN